MTHKQQLFIKEYQACLNATEAAKRAGYNPKTAYSIGHELLKKPEIQQAINQSVNSRIDSLIADSTERQEFLSAVMRDNSESMKNRLRACELLSKIQGDFMQNITVKTGNTLADLLLGA